MASNKDIAVLRIKGRPEDVIPILFRIRDDGRIHFEPGAYSLEPFDRSALESGVVRFEEIILERMARYGLTIHREPDGVVLAIHLSGGALDEKIPG